MPALPDLPTFADGEALCADDLNGAFQAIVDWACEQFPQSAVQPSSTFSTCVTIPQSCGTSPGEAVSGATLAACKEELQNQIDSLQTAQGVLTYGSQQTVTTNISGVACVSLPNGYFTTASSGSVTGCQAGQPYTYNITQITAGQVCFEVLDQMGAPEANASVEVYLVVTGV